MNSSANKSHFKFFSKFRIFPPNLSCEDFVSFSKILDVGFIVFDSSNTILLFVLFSIFIFFPNL